MQNPGAHAVDGGFEHQLPETTLCDGVNGRWESKTNTCKGKKYAYAKADPWYLDMCKFFFLCRPFWGKKKEESMDNSACMSLRGAKEAKLSKISESRDSDFVQH